jgi:hypothetical protein
LAAGAIAGWYLLSSYSLEFRQGQNGGMEYMRIVPRQGRGTSPGDAPRQVPPAAPRPSIRMATFDLDGLDETKWANHQVSDILVRIVSHFDILAVQGVRSKNHSVLVRLLEQVNALGQRSYDFAICPTADRDAVQQYNAFLFDAASVEIDRGTVHSVVDPQRRFRCQPLVGSFRVRGPAEAEAFTCTLINVQIDAERAQTELDSLADVFRAVRDYYRDEDDILVLGNLQADGEHLGRLGKLPYLTAAISGTPSTTRGTALLDNILFDRRTTVEFTGRSGVLDLLREFDLTPQAALEVSEHLPVWAEFSCYEGGQPGHVGN